MRGELSSDSIIDDLGISLDARFGGGFLRRRLAEDCRQVHINSSFLSELRKIASASFVVLATDNMDCFVNEFPSLRAVSKSFDSILCSSSIGVLKSDTARAFFEPWLNAHSLSFPQALLIDDNEEICEGFRSNGGTAVPFQSSAHVLAAVKNWLDH